MTRRTIPLCVTYVALLCVSSFGSEPANCPDSVDVNQQLTAPVSGWTTMIDDSPPRLANITFYDGPPQQRASLIYDQKMQVAGKETATWHFLRTRSGNYIVDEFGQAGRLLCHVGGVGRRGETG